MTNYDNVPGKAGAILRVASRGSFPSGTETGQVTEPDMPTGYCGSLFAHMPHRFEGPPSKDEHGDVYREWIHCHGRRISAPPAESASTDDNKEA